MRSTRENVIRALKVYAKNLRRETDTEPIEDRASYYDLLAAVSRLLSEASTDPDEMWEDK